MSEKHWSPGVWPWGQFGVFLLALSIFGLGMETLIVYSAVYARLVSPPTADGQSWLQPFVGFLVLAGVSCAIVAGILWSWRWTQGLPPITRWPRLRVISGALFVIGLLAQTIAMSLPAAVAARTSQQQLLLDDPWRETDFANGAMRISTPPNWEVVPNSKAPAASIYLAERQSGSGLTAVLVPKQDLAFQSLADFSKWSGKSLAESLTNAEFIKSESADHEGYPAIDAMQTGALSNVNLVWQSRYIEYPDAWFELRMWATPSHYQSHSETFDRIAASIRRGK